MKVIIAGGRDFHNKEKLQKECDEFLSKYPDDEIEIVSGMAAGADTLGYEYAKEKGYKVKEMPADWNTIDGRLEWQLGTRKDGSKYYKGAGYDRNADMADYGDILIAFYNGSNGTKNMIEQMDLRNKQIRIISY